MPRGGDPVLAVTAVTAREQMGGPMQDSTRRNFLAVAGLGTAGGVVALAAAGPASATAGAAAEDTALPGNAADSMAAYVHDIHNGKVTLLIEGRHVEVTDRALVAKMAQAFAKADRANGGR